MFFRCFSLVFFFKSLQAGGKKNTKCRKKRNVIPDPDKHERAHTTTTVDLLGTPHIPTPVRKSIFDRHFKGSLASYSVFGINIDVCVSGFYLSQKVNAELVHCNACAFVCLPIAQSQCGADNEKHRRNTLRPNVRARKQKPEK